MTADNRLYYGDNLEVLRERVADESVDLVYLDPPFNSNRNYNVIFSRYDVTDDMNYAQDRAFEDTWRWSPETDWLFRSAQAGGVPSRVADVLNALRSLLGENDAMAYLTNMAVRLVELHRVLRRSGSLYLHCDPTMSAYLRAVLDSIFGPEFFRNEIVWKRATTVKGNFGQGARHYGPSTDSLLFYTKSDDYTFNQQFTAYSKSYTDTAYRYVEEGTGRRYRLVSMIGPGGAAKGNPFYEVLGVGRYWRYSRARMQGLIDAGLVVQSKPGAVPHRKYYLDEGKGVPVQSLWDDIGNLQAGSAETLGYPTQKPVALLERIIATSSNEGDSVLDPFCGCGTAIDASVRLKRAWAGIDVAFFAVDLIEKRLKHTFGNSIDGTYEVHGIPKDTSGALALFDRSPFEFERWAVSLLQGTPNRKQVGDRGIDGIVRFPVDGKGGIGKALVSVKGGQHVGPQFVRDLLGTVQTEQAQMGLLTTLTKPTRGMISAAAHAGNYVWPVNGQVFPRLQVTTVPDLLAGRLPSMPTALMPYIAAGRQGVKHDQLSFGI